MLTSARDFALQVADHAGCSQEFAERAVRAVLTGVGTSLTPAQRELLAYELPFGLRNLLAGDGQTTSIEKRLLGPDLAPGHVRELIASVGRALADDLSTEALAELRAAAPGLAPFLVGSTASQHGAPPADTLAGGRPGSHRPLADSAPRR